MKYNLKVYTSFVSPLNIDTFIKRNLLPIFIIRNIKNSSIIGSYSDTSVHFKDLAPSFELFRSVRNNKITRAEFDKRYIIEMSAVNLFETLNRINYLAELCNADGVVLLGYGSRRELCHRSVLASLLDETGLLEEPIKELVI